MIYLGIETSCDETGVAIVEKKNEKFFVKSNLLASSISLHSKTGGIIPEYAAREQIKSITPLLKKTFEEIPLEKIDGIAVTYGPGLIGSLLVGVETAKTLSLVGRKDIIPVNHMHGHIYANFLSNTKIDFPSIVISAELRRD